MSETDKRKRADYKRNRKIWISMLAVLVALLTLASVALFGVYYQLNKTYYIDYTEKGTVDYKVKLKPNSFYDKEYLPAGQAYVATLIDGVVADFSYALNMESSNVKYDYSYKIDTQLLITENKTGDPLFAPVYDVKPEQRFTKSSASTLTVAEQVTIDYAHYNAIAEDFIAAYELSGVSSMLAVKMHVFVISSCEDFDADTVNEYVVALNIPLTGKTLGIEMSTSVPAAETKILACDRAENKDVFLNAAFGTTGGDLLLIIALLLVIFLTRNTDINYEIKVKKILSAYRSYIQKINNEFDTSGYRVLLVNSFNEMLDIRDTISAPILMHENEDQTRTQFFIPASSNILYVFEVKVDNYDALYTKVDAEEIAVAEEDAPVVIDEVAEVAVADEHTEGEAVSAMAPADGAVEVPAEAEPAAAAAEAEGSEEEEDAFGFASKYDYSFAAKLALADDDVKDFYRRVVSFARSYGVKVARSWKRERIYLGRNLFALLVFKGKKLAIALALDPATHGDPKYHAFDVSDVSKYARTPMLMRITSARKVKYTTELLGEIFATAGLADKQLGIEEPAVAHKTRKMLIAEGLIKTDLHPDEVEDTVLPVAPVTEEAPALPVEETADAAANSFDFGPKLDYSFEAKLSLAPPDVRDYYREVSDFARRYGVKVVRSWARERIYLGRSLFALLTFKGKKLAIALALDPATHNDPKYHALDMSGSRKYARTPMLMRITSARKVKYAIALLTELFAAAGLADKQLSIKPVSVPAKTKKALIKAGLIRTEGSEKK